MTWIQERAALAHIAKEGKVSGERLRVEVMNGRCMAICVR